MLIKSFMENKKNIKAPTSDAITSSMGVFDKPSEEGAINPFTNKKRNHNYKGGIITPHGYRMIWVGKKHHLADVRGYAYEHRVVAEQKYGRKIKENEHVHHIDGNKLNNHPDNLEILTEQEHRFKHRTVESNKKRPDEDNPIIECACGCGETFLKYDSLNRPRRTVYGHFPKKESPIISKIYDAINNGIKERGLICEYTGGIHATTEKYLCILVKQNILTRIAKGVYDFYGAKNIKENYEIECKCGCGTVFLKFDKQWRERNYVSGHNNGKINIK